MAKRNASGPPAAVGGSSLLVIFAVLCLTVFALLTLSTAAADSRIQIHGAHIPGAGAPGLSPAGGGKLDRRAVAGGLHRGLAGG